MMKPVPVSDYVDSQRERWRAEFPGSLYGDGVGLPPDLPARFEAALSAGSEEAIQQLMTANPYVIQYAVDHSGHHGIWAFPKQMIRPPATSATRGLIPDFLIVTRSSLGYYWYVVELKKADVQFANDAGSAMSRVGNLAVAQCMKYLAHMQDYIETVRRNVAIDHPIKPMGAVLLVGDSATESDQQRTLRSEFDSNNSRINVVTYDRIRRGIRNDVWRRV